MAVATMIERQYTLPNQSTPKRVSGALNATNGKTGQWVYAGTPKIKRLWDGKQQTSKYLNKTHNFLTAIALPMRTS